MPSSSTSSTPFSQPNGSLGAAAFDKITSTTTGPRVAQFRPTPKPMELVDSMAHQNC
ncbi:MAG TPA: hypothetical protein VK578_16495 [Edaphobacter sp.]|nr:hypothetical protein [Edaphobacter sp.]